VSWRIHASAVGKKNFGISQKGVVGRGEGHNEENNRVWAVKRSALCGKLKRDKESPGGQWRDERGLHKNSRESKNRRTVERLLQWS